MDALKLVSVNQAAILTRVEGEFYLLLSTNDSPLGRRIDFLLSHAWVVPDLYIVHLHAGFTTPEQNYLRILGPTRLPELRLYRDGSLVRRYFGMEDLQRWLNDQGKGL